MYFIGITDIEQNKQHYRNLAKHLHSDKRENTVEFQEMKDEYRLLLIRLQQNHKNVISVHQPSPENELISELGKLAKVLIKKQIPQEYLKRKIQITDSPLKKSLLSDLVDLFDNLK
jgi:hypothetical protein